VEFGELQRIIRDVEPPAPSARGSAPGVSDAERSAAARRRGTSPARLTADLRGELDWIVQRAMAKEPQQRYPSAGSLAADVQRRLAGAAIEAAPPSAAYRVRKFVRRYPAAVVGGIAVFAALASVAGISLAFGVRESRLRRDAELAKTRAEQAESQTRAKAAELEQVAKFQESQLAGVDPKTMGMRLRGAVLDKARAANVRARVATQQADERGTQLEQLIAGSDFTGLALEALSENFFEPTRAAIERDFARQPLLKARLLQSLASTLEEVGLLEAASQPQQEALRIRRELLGDEDRDTLTSQVALALLLLGQGEFGQAEESVRQAIDTCRRVLGEDDPVTLSASGTLGVVLRMQGKLAEAEPYYRESLANDRRVLGEEHAETLKSLTNLGGLLFAMARHDEAEPYFREALDQSRRLLGSEHVITLTAINNLGTLLQTQGKFAEAESYYRESLDAARRVLGDEHPDTLRFINNIGYLLFSQQRMAEAEAFYREALQTRRRVLGDEHPATLNSLNNLAGLLKEQGRFDEAEACYVEALDGRLRVLGADHPDTIGSLNNLGWLREAQGRLAEAEPYYREALDKHRLLWGDEHPSTLVSIINMASLRLGQARPAEAVTLLTDCEPAVRRGFTGANVVRIGRFLTLLGQARAAVGDFEAAESNLKEAHEILMSAVGATAEHRREALSRLVDLYDAWHAAAPGAGHDLSADHWREELRAWQAATHTGRHEAETTPSAAPQP
jgi:tetratricopeptide (TPR) repeat protein